MNATEFLKHKHDNAAFLSEKAIVQLMEEYHAYKKVEETPTLQRNIEPKMNDSAYVRLTVHLGL